MLALAVLLLAPALPAAPASDPAKIDRDAERWLREVHLLVLPDEEALFRGLASAEDRQQFQRLFWARRDPDPRTPKNELQDALGPVRGRADELFSVPGTRGSETGCGQVFLLLGDPAEVQGREARERFDSLQPMREGARRPETWIYRSRPGDAVAFTGGELRIAFDEACRFSEGGRVLEDLRRVAESRITRPDLDYRKTADGRLVRLEDLPGASVAATSTGEARALLESGRNDFPIVLEPKLLLRTQRGQAYAAGLVRADARAVLPEGAPKATGVIAVQAVPSSGPATAAAEKAFTTALGPDGSALASYGIALKPGRYTLRVGLLLSGGKGSVASVPVEVPDFDAPGLKAAALVLYPEEASPADPQDPYAALTVGSLRLRPRFGNVFTAGDALRVVSVLYGGQADAASKKAALRASFTILKDGKAVAKGEDQAFETAVAVAAVGPLPLAGFSPGRYVVRLEAADGVAGTTAAQEAAFEIRP